MTKSSNQTHAERLCRFALAQLPDSIQARKSVLNDIIAVLPRSSDMRLRAVTMLTHLAEHERCQIKLLLS